MSDNYPNGFTDQEIEQIEHLESLGGMQIINRGSAARVKMRKRIEEIIDTLEENTYKGLQDTTRELVEELLTLHSKIR